ncbi:hypothetical protein FHS70_004393 [Flammeovirga yaeyamensis]|nr:hypothetical protein [Flammeovirga yaeyamensis]
MEAITYLEIAAMGFMVPPLLVSIGYALYTLKQDKV